MLMRALAVGAVAALWTNAAQAEWEVSVFTGTQSSPHAGVTGDDPGGVGAFDFTAEWDGRSADSPIYYGVRATYWRTETLGFGVGLIHTKVYLDEDQRDGLGFSRFEMTDGLNIVTANVFRRWPDLWASGRLTPYVGFGAGLAAPHVDVESGGGKTFGYQVTGPAIMATAGVSYDITEDWSVFTEYSGTYSVNSADLDNGGSFETDIITNALNIGVSFSF